MPSTNSVATLTLTPMTKAEAGKMIDRLLGSYPSLSLHDPKTYISSVVSLFCGYPMWAGEKAVAKIQTTSKFVPTLAEMKPILDDYVRVPKYAEEFEKGAQEQRLRLAAPLERKPTLAELKAKHGPNWGITDPTRKDGAQVNHEAVLRAQFGDAAFDALPDAKPRDTFQQVKVPMQEAAE